MEIDTALLYSPVYSPRTRSGAGSLTASELSHECIKALWHSQDSGLATPATHVSHIALPPAAGPAAGAADEPGLSKHLSFAEADRPGPAPGRAPRQQVVHSAKGAQTRLASCQVLPPVYVRSAAHVQRREEKMAMLREELEQEELQGCTFQPQVCRDWS